MTSNRLASETSLYLCQHANNPVDWYPWGPEALGRARELDRPIFLSVGYSACHWCHVMEHESFEDPATAAVLNEHFVSIKVDREERPDVDDTYMKAVQLLNQGQGGWPMSVWLTPELKPFYAGTYYPPSDRYGRPSFRRVLTALAEAWRDRRDDVVRSAGEITAHLKGFGVLPDSPGQVADDQLLRHAADRLVRAFDPKFGGFGGAPKFPHALELRLLLRIGKQLGDVNALAAVRTTLDQMARGGMYDQLGGGFHRYSVDERWLVPHFEKMLYDNALLSVAYLEAFQATGEPFYRQITEEILDYVLADMTAPSGAFYSTRDADSEGEEGKFYVWSLEEIERILDADDAKFAAAVWDVTPGGNFEGHNILWRRRSDADDAAKLGATVEEFRGRLDVVKKQLLAEREKRVHPGRDEKVLTSWNGLMIAGFARAGAVLAREDYVRAAVRAGEFVLNHLRRGDGRLWHTSSANGEAKVSGFLEDYAYAAEAFTHLYEATFDLRWLTAASELMDATLDHFADAEAGGFFTTASDHEELLHRAKDMHDGSTPAGNSMAVTALLRLAELTGRADFREAADQCLRAFRGVMETHPTASGQMLIAWDFRVGPVQQVAIAGDATSPAYREVLRAARSPFAPHRVVAGSGPLLKDRPASGPMTLYVCENFACQTPVTEVTAAVTLLQK